jgi:colanic acid/amylovoran biosynthesis glycosyltransferase
MASMASDELQRADRQRVAYLVLQFPRLSETFVAREIAGLQARGWDVAIYPLWRNRSRQVHQLVKPLLPQVQWPRPLLGALVSTNLRVFRRRPLTYLRVLAFVAGEMRSGLKRGLKALAAFPLMVWIAEDMRRRGFRHVHAHFASYPALAALVARRLCGVSYSFTGHAYDLYVKPSRLPEKVAEAAFVVAISAYNQRILRQAGPTPVHVVHCGVPVPERLPPYAPRRGHLLCVARLEEKKGHAYLIEACRILMERGVDVTCTCIGAGPLERALGEQIARSGLSERVVLAGPRTQEDVQRALSTAALFVLPSVVTASGNAEGIPVALMEAMAAGVPVVSTMTTGVPELIDDGLSGTLVPPRDAGALADAIARLLEDRERCERFRVAAFQRVATEFRTDVAVEKVAAYLSEAVCSGDTRGPFDRSAMRWVSDER